MFIADRKPWASAAERQQCSRLQSRSDYASLFFHVINGRHIIDDEGTEFAGLDEARAEAIVTSGEMLKDLGGKFWSNCEWQMRVTDEAGDKVCVLTFAADRS
jgi:hypothetical protein